MLERSINRKPLLIKWWMLLIKHGCEANNFDRTGQPPPITARWGFVCWLTVRPILRFVSFWASIRSEMLSYSNLQQEAWTFQTIR